MRHLMTKPIAALLPLVLASCYSQADLDARLQKIAKLDAEVRETREKNGKALSEKTRKMEALRAENAVAQARADSTEASVTGARLDRDSLSEEFATYRQSYRDKLFQELDTHTFPIVTFDGREPIRDLRVTKLADNRIHYKTASGSGMVKASQLPSEIAEFLRTDEAQQDRFYFPEIAKTNTWETPAANGDAAVSQSTTASISDSDRRRETRVRPRRALYGESEEASRIRKRIIEIEASLERLSLDFSTLRKRRSQHAQLIRERGSYQSKSALREIDALEAKLRKRSITLQQKKITLNEMYKKLF